MASSLELEVKTALTITNLTNMGAVIRLATETAPTPTEAQASKGYVSLSVESNSTRKFSISQHYDTDFTNGGLTLDDVLAPNTSYKLYLYPKAIDLGQTVIKGGVVKENRVEISFTTASLPPAGDTVWSEKLANKEYITSLNEYHFMENQVGISVAYFWSPIMISLIEVATLSNGARIGVGTYVNDMASPDSRFYYDSGLISGYPSTMSQYMYSISVDKIASPILRNEIKLSVTPQSGPSVAYITIIERY